MATNASFNSMLKRYMPYQLLVEEVKKRNYFWNKVKKDEGWKGGSLEVPFEGAEASSLSMGALTAADDIAESEYVMGLITSQPELWGTMKFHEKDLDRHGDLEQSYLKIVPGKINQFVGRMSERISLMLLGDGSICTLTADGEADGDITVDHPERLTLGEKVIIDDSDSTAAEGYVAAINVNSGVVNIVTARGGSTGVDLSGFTVAAGAKVYLPGVQGSGFTSLAAQLLPSGTGNGSATLFGQTKTDYPFLQAQVHDGSGFTAATLLDDVFGVFYDTINLGKGNANEVIMSFDRFKDIAAALHDTKRATITEKTAGYGWRSVNLIGPEGDMKITAIRDMPKDLMYILDWDGITFHGDKFFERKRHLNGDEFYLSRATTGYEYILDIKFYGDLVVSKPSHCGVVHTVDY